MKKYPLFIFVFSLVPALISCLLILVWIHFQIGTDCSFGNIDRIVSIESYYDGRDPSPYAPPQAGPLLMSERPELEAYVRMLKAGTMAKYGSGISDVNVYWTDAAFREIFTPSLIEGRFFDGEEADICVITQSLKSDLFGAESPLGKSIDINGIKCSVCGVIKDFPRHRTVFPAESDRLVLASMASPWLESRKKNWYYSGFETYGLLKKQTRADAFDQDIKDRLTEYTKNYKIYLTSSWLKDRYLYRDGNIRNVYIMGALAGMILLIASVNCINIATAGFSRAVPKYGLMKILGASRKRLIRESLFKVAGGVFFSFCLAWVATYGLGPVFRTAVEGGFEISGLYSFRVSEWCVFLFLVITLLIGLYPAVYFSAFSPLVALKYYNLPGGWNQRLRQLLVVFQFCVSIILCFCALTMARQIRMYYRADLGYDWKNMIYIKLRTSEQMKKTYELKEELEKLHGVVAVGISTDLPTAVRLKTPEVTWEGAEKENPCDADILFADRQWYKVYNIRLQEGGFPDISDREVLINKQMSGSIGKKDVLGLELDAGFGSARICGVTDKFLYGDFKKKSRPLVFHLLTRDGNMQGSFISIRVADGTLKDSYREIAGCARRVFNEETYVRGLKEDIDGMLLTERQIYRMTLWFTAIAVLICCMGIYGLSLFMVSFRRKEMAVRMVFGAGKKDILELLNRRFIVFLAIGAAIGYPVAYTMAEKWLERFALRVPVCSGVYILIVLVMAVLTSGIVSYTARKSFREKPVKFLNSGAW